MRVDRWAEVARVCHAALEREPEARPAFVASACAGDEDLQREVESLLAEQGRAADIFDTPPWQLVAPALASDPDSDPDSSPGSADTEPPVFSPGSTIGPFKILAALGAGGMGQLYKARDTRLDRDVAIKVLPAAASANPERRLRFEREARTIAGLNHPHICTLYDVGEFDGSTYLVLEHLSGETLATRLQRGRLPLEQALTVATEIADGLAAAHRQGIVHRDLKPGNVMMTRTGAKLLDFGLAKLTGHGETPAATHLAAEGTPPTPSTGKGMILGTLQYMAPEQLEAKPADARTDLWSLGALLYEMVTGRRAFVGANAVHLIGAILEEEPPPIATLQPLAPPSLDRLVRQCLAKAPDDRPDTAHDVANELRWMREANHADATVDARPRRGRALRLVLAGAIVLIAAVALTRTVGLWLPAGPHPLVTRVSLDVQPADELSAGGVGAEPVPTPGGSRTALSWTADGQALVFVGRRGGVQQLYVRRLDAAEARPLEGTEDAQAPAVSANGRWVAFWADGKIKRAPLGEGPVMDLASGFEVPPSSLAWDDRGRLFFGTWDGSIGVIEPDGKTGATTIPGEAEALKLLPWPLPGGRAVLYTVRRREWSWGDEEIVVQTLDGGRRKRLLTDAADARYLPTGHLAFLRQGRLFAVPFDAERLELRGQPLPVLDGVAQALSATGSADVTGAGQFAVSAAGTLAWLPGPVTPYARSALVTVDRRGNVSRLPAPSQSYGGEVRVSPHGHRLVVTVQTLNDVGLWLYDLGRETFAPVPVDGEASWPIWSADGKRLVFNRLKDGRRSIVTMPADGSAPPQILVPGPYLPSSSTLDGQQIATASSQPDSDIHIVTVENGTGRAWPLFETPHAEVWPAFSPDGHWLAYGSDVSGRFQVYVRPYAGPGPAEPVSADGGESPAWNPNGRELFYVTPADAAGDRGMMAVEFAAEPARPPASADGSPNAASLPRMGRPRLLFTFHSASLRLACGPLRCYDVAPDGQSFYGVQTVTPAAQPVVTHVSLIQNWFEELKARVPAK